MRKKVLTIESCANCPHCSAMSGGNVGGFFDISAGAGADARRYLFCRHKDGPRGTGARFPIVSEQMPLPGKNFEPPAWCPLEDESHYYETMRRLCLDRAEMWAGGYRSDTPQVSMVKAKAALEIASDVERWMNEHKSR